MRLLNCKMLGRGPGAWTWGVPNRRRRKDRLQSAGYPAPDLRPRLGFHARVASRRSVASKVLANKLRILGEDHPRYYWAGVTVPTHPSRTLLG